MNIVLLLGIIGKKIYIHYDFLVRCLTFLKFQFSITFLFIVWFAWNLHQTVWFYKFFHFDTVLLFPNLFLQAMIFFTSQLRYTKSNFERVTLKASICMRINAIWIFKNVTNYQSKMISTWCFRGPRFKLFFIKLISLKCSFEPAHEIRVLIT